MVIYLVGMAGIMVGCKENCSCIHFADTAKAFVFFLIPIWVCIQSEMYCCSFMIEQFQTKNFKALKSAK